jgi:predicted Zn finger-like uncharacterized protein
MYVACPSCKSLYSISAGQLAAAGGQVRCSQCQTLFNATHAVFDTPHEALAYEYPVQKDVAQEIDELVGRALDQVPGGAGGSSAGVASVEGEQSRPDDAEVEEFSDERELDDDIAESFDEFLEPALRADADGYAQPVTGEFISPVDDEDDPFGLPGGLLLEDALPSGSATNWWAIAAAMLLTVVLLTQYAWWDRNRLAQISALRPLLESLCQPLDCRLPLRHDLARVEMVEREVRDHPNVKNALLVSAAFVNRASYQQAYPVLQIAFSDISGAPVAVRRFMPEEYLHDREPGQGMAPGERTLVMLEVVDPGERAVSFQFDFM